MLTQFILLPLYIYPSNNAWAPLYSAIEANPLLQFSLVIDPANGPGSGTHPDSNWIAGLKKLNSFTNTQLLGYVHTTEATRPLNDVFADINTYATWAKYSKADIHVDGIFFDESPSTCDSSTCPYMGNATAHVKTALGVGNDYTVFNAGVHGTTLIDGGLYALADTIIVFEDYYSQFSSAKVSAIPTAFRKQSAFILHDFTGTTSTQTMDVNLLTSNGVPGVYITSQSDYDLWSVHWANFVSSMSSAAFVSKSTEVSATGETTSIGVAGTKLRRSMFSRRQVGQEA